MKNGLESELVRGTGGRSWNATWPKQREACPSTVSSASDERMPQRSSTAVRMYENCTLSSDPYTELWTCVCVCVCACYECAFV